MATPLIPQGAVESALMQQLYGRFTVSESTVSVATTSTQILKNNPERVGFVMINSGSYLLTISIRADLELYKGFVLSQRGDTMASLFIEDGILPILDFYGIADTTAGEITIYEFIRGST